MLKISRETIDRVYLQLIQLLMTWHMHFFML